MSKDPNMGKTLNVRGKQATVKDYDKLSLHEKREGADSIVDIAGQRYDYYSNSMHNGIGSLVPHKDDPKIDMNSSQFKVGDKGMITLNSGTIPIKVLDKATLNHKLMYLVQEDRPLAGSAHMRKFWTADYNVKSIPDSKNTKSKKTSDGKTVSIQHTSQAVQVTQNSQGKGTKLSKEDAKKTYLVCESKDGVKSRVYTYHNKMTKQQGFINSERKLDVFIHTKGNTLSDSEYDKLVNQACKDYISTLTPDKQKKANEFMPKRGTFVHWERVKNILSIK